MASGTEYRGCRKKKKTITVGSDSKTDEKDEVNLLITIPLRKKYGKFSISA